VFAMTACSGGSAPSGEAGSDAPAESSSAAAESSEAAEPSGSESESAEASAEADGGGSVGTKGRIAFINYINAHPYFTHAKDAALAAGEELGYEVIYDGPPDVDTPKFASLIEDYTAQGVDALIVAALDDSVAPQLKAARDKGIQVVTWDLDLPDSSARDVYAGLGDYVSFTGTGIAESMVKNIGEEGTWAMIDGEPSSAMIMERGDFVEQYIKENYPGLKMVAREAAGEDPQKAYTIAQNLLTAYPEIDCILANTSPPSAAAGKVIEEFGLLGEVYVCGESNADLAGPALESGASKAFYTWDTAEWADFAVRVAAKLVEGEEMPEGNPEIEGYPNATREGDLMYYNSDFIFLTLDNIEELGGELSA